MPLPAWMRREPEKYALWEPLVAPLDALPMAALYALARESGIALARFGDPETGQPWLGWCEFDEAFPDQASFARAWEACHVVAWSAVPGWAARVAPGAALPVCRTLAAPPSHGLTWLRAVHALEHLAPREGAAALVDGLLRREYMAVTAWERSAQRGADVDRMRLEAFASHKLVRCPDLWLDPAAAASLPPPQRWEHLRLAYEAFVARFELRGADGLVEAIRCVSRCRCEGVEPLLRELRLRHPGARAAAFEALVEVGSLDALQEALPEQYSAASLRRLIEGKRHEPAAKLWFMLPDEAFPGGRFGAHAEATLATGDPVLLAGLSDRLGSHPIWPQAVEATFRLGDQTHDRIAPHAPMNLLFKLPPVVEHLGPWLERHGSTADRYEQGQRRRWLRWMLDFLDTKGPDPAVQPDLHETCEAARAAADKLLHRHFTAEEIAEQRALRRARKAPDRLRARPVARRGPW